MCHPHQRVHLPSPRSPGTTVFYRRSGFTSAPDRREGLHSSPISGATTRPFVAVRRAGESAPARRNWRNHTYAKFVLKTVKFTKPEKPNAAAQLNPLSTYIEHSPESMSAEGVEVTNKAFNLCHSENDITEYINKEFYSSRSCSPAPSSSRGQHPRPAPWPCRSGNEPPTPACRPDRVRLAR